MIRDGLGWLRALALMGVAIVLLTLPASYLASHPDEPEQTCFDGGFHPAGESPCTFDNEDAQFRLGGIIVLLGLVVLPVLWLEGKVTQVRHRRLRTLLEVRKLRQQESRI